MGRAIVRNPKVFLFDEPLSNLDAKLRVQMRTEIKKVHQKVRTTTVYVTHDQVEAMTLADRVVVMNQRPHRAGRHAARALPPAADALRRRLHRLAGDEFHALPAGRDGDGALRVRLADDIVLPVPPARAARYRPHAASDDLLRAAARAHHRGASATAREQLVPFEAELDVTEPMGMETLVYFRINGTRCAAASTRTPARATARRCGSPPTQQHAPDRRGDRPGDLGIAAAWELVWRFIS